MQHGQNRPGVRSISEQTLDEMREAVFKQRRCNHFLYSFTGAGDGIFMVEILSG